MKIERDTRNFSSSKQGEINRKRQACHNFAPGGVHLSAFGDYGSGNENQRAVAAQIVQFSQQLSEPLAAVVTLGDNFYGKVTAERFEEHFEKMYPIEFLDIPFYICAGNVDYGKAKHDFQEGKLDLLFEYAEQNPDSRWKFPAKWYSLEFPDSADPLVRLIVLDGNYWPGGLSAKEKEEQEHFLMHELSRKMPARWTWLVNHFPLFSHHTDKDHPELIEQWGPLLNQHRIAMCLAGHEHNMQHLEIEGYYSSFITSGAGGANLYKIEPSRHAEFVDHTLGFNHFHIHQDWIDTQFINEKGECLHAFRRHFDGRVETR